GFSAFVRKPMRNNRVGESGGSARASNGDEPAPGRTACQASHSRYAAPNHLSISYPSGMAMNIAVSPAAAENMCNRKPVATPNSEMKAALRRWHDQRGTP